MEALKSDQRLVAFRAADAFAVEAFRLAASLPSGAAGAGLAADIRRTALAAGGAVVAAAACASGGSAERAHLERARVALHESRYYLHLARRFGWLDARRYRALTLRQDAATRELDAVLVSAG
jgi:four helix bundle protein